MDSTGDTTLEVDTGGTATSYVYVWKDDPSKCYIFHKTESGATCLSCKNVGLQKWKDTQPRDRVWSTKCDESSLRNDPALNHSEECEGFDYDWVCEHYTFTGDEKPNPKYKFPIMRARRIGSLGDGASNSDCDGSSAKHSRDSSGGKVRPTLARRKGAYMKYKRSRKSAKTSSDDESDDGNPTSESENFESDSSPVAKQIRMQSSTPPRPSRRSKKEQNDESLNTVAIEKGESTMATHTEKKHRGWKKKIIDDMDATLIENSPLRSVNEYNADVFELEEEPSNSNNTESNMDQNEIKEPTSSVVRSKPRGRPRKSVATSSGTPHTADGSTYEMVHDNRTSSLSPLRSARLLEKLQNGTVAVDTTSSSRTSLCSLRAQTSEANGSDATPDGSKEPQERPPKSSIPNTQSSLEKTKRSPGRPRRASRLAPSGSGDNDNDIKQEHQAEMVDVADVPLTTENASNLAIAVAPLDAQQTDIPVIPTANAYEPPGQDHSAQENTEDARSSEVVSIVASIGPQQNVAPARKRGRPRKSAPTPVPAKDPNNDCETVTSTIVEAAAQFANPACATMSSQQPLPELAVEDSPIADGTAATAVPSEEMTLGQIPIKSVTPDIIVRKRGRPRKNPKTPSATTSDLIKDRPGKDQPTKANEDDEDYSPGPSKRRRTDASTSPAKATPGRSTRARLSGITTGIPNETSAGIKAKEMEASEIEQAESFQRPSEPGVGPSDNNVVENQTGTVDDEGIKTRRSTAEEAQLQKDVELLRQINIKEEAEERRENAEGAQPQNPDFEFVVEEPIFSPLKPIEQTESAQQASVQAPVNAPPTPKQVVVEFPRKELKQEIKEEPLDEPSDYLTAQQKGTNGQASTQRRNVEQAEEEALAKLHASVPRVNGIKLHVNRPQLRPCPGQPVPSVPVATTSAVPQVAQASPAAPIQDIRTNGSLPNTTTSDHVVTATTDHKPAPVLNLGTATSSRTRNLKFSAANAKNQPSVDRSDVVTSCVKFARLQPPKLPNRPKVNIHPKIAGASTPAVANSMMANSSGMSGMPGDINVSGTATQPGPSTDTDDTKPKTRPLKIRTPVVSLVFDVRQFHYDEIMITLTRSRLEVSANRRVTAIDVPSITLNYQYTFADDVNLSTIAFDHKDQKLFVTAQKKSH